MPLTMQQPNWRSQAPGNTMILGEHSVVYGHPALACAVNHYVDVFWRQRQDQAVHIDSALGQHHTQIHQLTPHPKLTFVMAALQRFQTDLPSGLDIEIQSEFPATIGLGSSAAVLAAMLSGLNQICGSHHSLMTLFEIGHEIIIELQGRGSGTDLAASLYGGLILFQPKQESTPANIETLPARLKMSLVYSGYKTPTAEVLKRVAEQWHPHPKQLEMLYRAMAKVTRTAYHELLEGEMEHFYQCCKEYQHLMEKLGVSDDTLEKLIRAMNGCREVHAAKISGSGLGDCVLALGQLQDCSSSSQNLLRKHQQINIEISEHGAFTETLNPPSK